MQKNTQKCFKCYKKLLNLNYDINMHLNYKNNTIILKSNITWINITFINNLRIIDIKELKLKNKSKDKKEKEVN